MANKSDLDKKKRVDNFLYQREIMLNQGYKAHNGTISIIKANLMVFVTAGPFALLAVLIYLLLYGEIINYDNLNIASYNITLFLFIISIPVHEFLHGFTWHFYCKEKWKSIHFGVMWKYLTPYCHCKEPLKFGGYLLGVLMPFFILGIGGSILGILLQNALLLFFGILNILAAGGDTTIALMLRKFRKAIIIDHPNECGFVAFMK